MQALRSWILAAWCIVMLTVSATAETDSASPPPGAHAEESAAAPEASSSPASAPPSAPPAALPATKADAVEATAPAPVVKDGAPVRVQVIPVRDAIAKPILYVIRRGLKEAQAAGVRVVVIDMETPGGELGVTLQIMEALDKFDGETLVYVNKEAVSAGAIISSVADEIYFAPGGVIGAAAAVNSGGEDIGATMKQKINSYMNAKVRSFNTGKGYRSEVIRAMMDADYEFKIGDTVIKPKGELLSLTADEAAKTYGEPAQPLLSSGTHATIEDLLTAKYGKGGYSLAHVEVNWSEELASWLTAISPVLLGLGLLCVFIELKTPGFGVFGITGGVLLALVFFGQYAAGLSGHLPALVFVVGLGLVAVEIFVLPGTLAPGLVGALLMLGSLVWSMLDVWPGQMPTLDAATLFWPLLNLATALAVAVVAGALVWRFLPHGWILDHIAVGGATLEPAQSAGAAPSRGHEITALIGREGVAVTALVPSGHIQVEGRRYEAQVAVGALAVGTRVRVAGRKDFSLLVEPVN